MKTRLLLLSIFISSFSFAQVYNWTQQPTNVTIQFLDVFFIDDQTGWVVGQNGTIMNTTDGGQTWSDQVTPVSEILRAVFFIDANNGWAAGGLFNVTLVRTTDGGATWTSSTTGLDGRIYDVAFANANEGWAVTQEDIFVTTDGGATWTAEAYSSVVVSGLANRAISVTSDTSVFVASKFNQGALPSATVFDRLTNSSGLWTPDPGGSYNASEQLISICFADPLMGFAGGNTGRIYRMSGDGINFNGPWLMNFDTGTNSVINDISFPTATTGMFNASTNIGADVYALVYHTSDVGDTWSAPDSIMGLYSWSVHAPDTLNAWVVGSLGMIYKGTRNPVGISEYSLPTEISVVPNPFTSDLTINLSGVITEVRSIEISDVQGRIITTIPVATGGLNSIRISELNAAKPGVYFIRTLNNAGVATGVERIMKI